MQILVENYQQQLYSRLLDTVFSFVLSYIIFISIWLASILLNISSWSLNQPTLFPFTCNGQVNEFPSFEYDYANLLFTFYFLYFILQPAAVLPSEMIELILIKAAAFLYARHRMHLLLRADVISLVTICSVCCEWCTIITKRHLIKLRHLFRNKQVIFIVFIRMRV